MRRFELIAPCHFGMESVLKREITDLGYDITEVADGRVTFFGDEEALCRANIFLRTAERILIKIGSFHAETFEELFQGTKNLPWEEYIPKDGRFWVAKAASVKSKLFSPSDIQSIMKKAMVERLKAQYEISWFPEDGKNFPVRVFLMKDEVTVGLDSTGESLHKRGYRKLTAKAPIAENLAAALIELTPWNAGRILVDPFCGSGTFPIEAAMMAANMAPGRNRSFTAEEWPHIVGKKVWYDAMDEAEEMIDLSVETDIQGYDIDEDMVKIARENARMAGVDKLIHFQRRGVEDLHHPKKYGFIITNPPYGERLQDKSQMPQLYRTIGERFRELDSWSMYLITAYEQAEKDIGRKADKNRKIYNGMMKTYYYHSGTEASEEKRCLEEMKNLLQIRDQQQNRRITLILWLLLGSMSMGIMLWTAAHKTVVISALSQEQGGLVTENQAERSHEMQLAMAEDRKAEREICIPLETGTKAENVVVENHYMEKELWIYVQNGRKTFYREHQLTGDFSLVGNGICEAQNEGVLLRLSMKEILEYHSTLEEGSLKIDFVNPRENYDKIVVLDPVGGGREKGVETSGCEEKTIALEVARQTAQLLEGGRVKVYLTRTEDTEITQEARQSFADWVDADLYLEIGLSADDTQESTYGIRAEYNDEYYLPDFGNVQWADVVTRQVTVAASNRAIGLFPAEEDDILWQLKIPAARISLGYVTNSSERQLLLQESYQKKLAEGIAEAISEVYTNTQ